jgi:AraC-like DNA-binding protein
MCPETQHMYTLHGIKAERAVQVLIRDGTAIRTVKEWAKEAGIGVSTLNKLMSDVYSSTPGDILKQVKYEKIIRVMQRDVNACAFSIAIDSDFSGEAAMRMFLRRRYNTNISTLREGLLLGLIEYEQKWLSVS